MHPEQERLHLYLCGALGPGERQAVEAHLADCADCGLMLAELAAEDAALTDALGLAAAEREWIEAVDLVEPVMAQIAPPRVTPQLVLVGLLLALAGYVGGSNWAVAAALLPEPDAGSIVRLVRTVGPDLIRLLAWLGQGGLLTVIWPLIAVGAALGFRHVILAKEAKRYA